jgi:hypothetical protein
MVYSDILYSKANLNPYYTAAPIIMPVSVGEQWQLVIKPTLYLHHIVFPTTILDSDVVQWQFVFKTYSFSYHFAGVW